MHVIVGTQNRHPYFRRQALPEAVFEIIADYPTTWAACLMPDHLHWLMVPEDLPRDVGQLKSLTTRRAWRCGHEGRLWQRSFYDRVARASDDLLAMAEYIVANPVRASLVSDPSDYPWVALFAERISV